MTDNSDRRGSRFAAACATACAAFAACSGGESPDVGWTIERAESITMIRGLHVRVHECRGRGPAHGDPRRYVRFACYAGHRGPRDAHETVAVEYELRVHDSSYVLENVRFHGGPGIP
jgi:hypothetical protein